VVQNLQSKFSAGTTGTSQRLGAFGSLLGDKAAEVTAMAQQSLGDYVPTAFPSGLASSSLSGFTSGASGLFAGFKGLRGSNGWSDLLKRLANCSSADPSPSLPLSESEPTAELLDIAMHMLAYSTKHMLLSMRSDRCPFQEVGLPSWMPGMKNTACVNDTNVTAAFFCKQVVHNQQDAALRWPPADLVLIKLFVCLSTQARLPR